MEQNKKRNESEKPPEPAEQRKDPRYPFSTTAEVIDILGNIRIVGRTSDIARKGCYIDTISPFAAKSTVALRITKENQSFETGATVVYSQVGMGMGLLFTTAKTDHLRLLETWLEALGGEGLAEPTILRPVLDFSAPKAGDHGPQAALSELIVLLGRKGFLTGSEGSNILQKLFKV